MKQDKILTETFELFAKANNLKIQASHFEGEKYISAKAGTIALQFADRRCGNLVAIAINKTGGRISTITPYMKPRELIAYMDGAMTNFKQLIQKLTTL